MISLMQKTRMEPDNKTIINQLTMCKNAEIARIWEQLLKIVVVLIILNIS